MKRTIISKETVLLNNGKLVEVNVFYKNDFCFVHSGEYLATGYKYGITFNHSKLHLLSASNLELLISIASKVNRMIIKNGYTKEFSTKAEYELRDIFQKQADFTPILYKTMERTLEGFSKRKGVTYGREYNNCSFAYNWLR
jgi:hypothetical protein